MTIGAVQHQPFVVPAESVVILGETTSSRCKWVVIVTKDKERFTMIKMLKNLHKEESGQDLIEYALIAALIAVTLVAGLNGLATKIQTVFTNVGTALTS